LRELPSGGICVAEYATLNVDKYVLPKEMYRPGSIEILQNIIQIGAFPGC